MLTIISLISLFIILFLTDFVYSYYFLVFNLLKRCLTQLFFLMSYVSWVICLDIVMKRIVFCPFKANLGFVSHPTIMLFLFFNTPNCEWKTTYAEYYNRCDVVSINSRFILFNALIIMEFTDFIDLLSLLNICTATIGIVQGLWHWIPSGRGCFMCVMVHVILLG